MLSCHESKAKTFSTPPPPLPFNFLLSHCLPHGEKGTIQPEKIAAAAAKIRRKRERDSPLHTLSCIFFTIFPRLAYECTLMISCRLEAMLTSSLLYTVRPTATTTTWTPSFFKARASWAVSATFVDIPSVRTIKNLAMFWRELPANKLVRACDRARYVLVPPPVYFIVLMAAAMELYVKWSSKPKITSDLVPKRIKPMCTPSCEIDSPFSTFSMNSLDRLNPLMRTLLEASTAKAISARWRQTVMKNHSQFISDYSWFLLQKLRMPFVMSHTWPWCGCWDKSKNELERRKWLVARKTNKSPLHSKITSSI